MRNYGAVSMKCRPLVEEGIADVHASHAMREPLRPANSRGWIYRVFLNGWAYDEAPDGTLGKRLTRIDVYLIGIGGADGGTYTRHGYDKAMRTQIDHGNSTYAVPGSPCR
jgi:Flavodoxin-like fold